MGEDLQKRTILYAIQYYVLFCTLENELDVQIIEFSISSFYLIFYLKVYMLIGNFFGYS